MPALQNDRLIRALCRQPTDSTPVWIMRQAGRYLPEYRDIRAQAGSFLNLCKNPELACEVTLQPLRRFDLDAAILFSDILTIPDAMGLGLYFTEGEGPQFKCRLTRRADIENLPSIDPNSDLQYVMNTIRAIRAVLNDAIPLIGFSGSPWTLACYMLEGSAGGKSVFPQAQRLRYQDPQLLHVLLDKLVIAISDYLNAQIEAGAQAIMLFDTWGGLLSPDDYVEFSQRKMTAIVNQLNTQRNGGKIPVVLFTKGGARNLEEFMASGADGIGLDWTVDIGAIKAQVGNALALQGNLNPCVLLTDPDTIETEVKKVLASFGRVAYGQGHVFNLGHGITPKVPIENVTVLIEAIKCHSPTYHSPR